MTNPQEPNQSAKSEAPKTSWQHPATIIALVAAVGTAFGTAITPIILEMIKRSPEPDLTTLQTQDITSLLTICGKTIEHIEDYQDQDSAVEVVSDTLDACNDLIEQGKATEEVYVDHLRASVFLWEHGEPSQSGRILEDGFNAFEQTSFLNELSPKARFYKGYIEDFRELVLSTSRASNSGSKIICPISETRYSSTIQEYKALYASVLQEYREKRRTFSGDGTPEAVVTRQERLSEEEAYILIELGHWLHNRDRNFDLALDMYDIVLAHYSGSGHLIEHNALASRGVVLFSKGDYGASVRMFNAALEIEESPELRGNLGAALAMAKIYKEASNNYQTAFTLEDQSVGRDVEKLYGMKRAQAYALLLQGILVDRPLGQDVLARQNYQDAVTLLRELSEIAPNQAESDNLFHTALGMAYYYLERLDDSLHHLQESLKLNAEDTISREFINVLETENSGEPRVNDVFDAPRRLSIFINPIPHDIGHDPVLDIRHGAFYCDPEVHTWDRDDS